MSKKNNLNDVERDVLDGMERPSLPGHILSDKDPGLEAKQLPAHQNLKDSTAETKDKAEILDAIKKLLKDQEVFDPLTHEKTAPGGVLGRQGLSLDEEEMDALLEHAKTTIASVKEKAMKLKNAVIERQKVSPTVVTFKPQQKSLLKKGMVRVFGHKDNTITFDHYAAALAARHALAEKNMEDQMSGLNRVLKQ